MWVKDLKFIFSNGAIINHGSVSDFKQEAHGHIAHLRKQFKSINTYDLNTINKEKKNRTIFIFNENWMVLHLNKLEFPSPKYALCQSWLKLAQQFWRRKYFNFINVIPWKRTGLFIWINLNPYISQGCFVPSLVGIGPMVQEKDVFLKFRQMYFRYFIIISPLKRPGPFICSKLNPGPLPKDALCQVWLKLV